MPPFLYQWCPQKSAKPELRDKDAVGSTSDGAAMPAADGPCPVCPLLEEKLKATREAAYWRVMHHRATEREAKLKLRIAELEAKLRLREQQLFGRKTETAPSTQPQLTGSPTTAGSPKRPRGQQRGQQGHGRRDYSHLPADIEDAELTGDDGCCPQCKRPFEPIGGTENSTVLEIEVRAPIGGLSDAIAIGPLVRVAWCPRCWRPRRPRVLLPRACSGFPSG